LETAKKNKSDKGLLGRVVIGFVGFFFGDESTRTAYQNGLGQKRGKKKKPEDNAMSGGEITTTRMTLHQKFKGGSCQRGEAQVAKRRTQKIFRMQEKFHREGDAYRGKKEGKGKEAKRCKRGKGRSEQGTGILQKGAKKGLSPERRSIFGGESQVFAPSQKRTIPHGGTKIGDGKSGQKPPTNLFLKKSKWGTAIH